MVVQPYILARLTDFHMGCVSQIWSRCKTSCASLSSKAWSYFGEMIARSGSGPHRIFDGKVLTRFSAHDEWSTMEVVTKAIPSQISSPKFTDITMVKRLNTCGGYAWLWTENALTKLSRPPRATGRWPANDQNRAFISPFCVCGMPEVRQKYAHWFKYLPDA